MNFGCVDKWSELEGWGILWVMKARIGKEMVESPLSGFICSVASSFSLRLFFIKSTSSYTSVTNHHHYFEVHSPSRSVPVSITS